MTDALSAPCWTRANADAVLQTQALAAEEAIFLATHTPVRDFEAASEKFDLETPSQEGLLKTLSDPSRRHAFCVVQGEPGSGKSHLIRWLQVNWPVERDFCLLIQRADGSLLGALKQLKTKLPAELGYLFDGLGQRHAAGLEGRALQFLTTLGAMLATNYFDEPPEDIDWCREFEPEKLILSAPVREHWKGPDRILRIMSGGKERNSASATFDIPDVLELAELWHAHTAGDSEKAQRLGLKLSLESSVIEEAVSEGLSWDAIRAERADEIPHTLQLVQSLNARRNQAVQGVLGVSAEALKRLFMELRAELSRQDREKPEHERRRLVLLLEDVTMWEGLDDSLVDALVADATLRDDDVCPLISVIGLTTEYFRQLKTNYRQRITHSVRLGVTAEGQPREIAALGDSERAGFVARYLSAVRTGVDSLVAWRAAYREDPTLEPPNPCRTCARAEPCFRAFGETGGVGLFPFTVEAIDGFYRALKTDDDGQTHRTPRGMLQGVLNPTLLNPDRLEAGAYPGPEIESRYLEPPLLDGALKTLLRNRAGNPVTETRLTRVMRYWGDLRPRLTALDGVERFAGVQREVLEAFQLPWIGEGQAASVDEPPVRQLAPIVESGTRAVAARAEGTTPSAPSPRPRSPSVRPVSEPRLVSKSELQQVLEQLDALRNDGPVPNVTELNTAVYAVIRSLDPRRLGADRRMFEQVFTASNTKIAGTGQTGSTHFVVPRENWLLDGLEAYARLRIDDDLTGEQVEYHRGRLARLSRRLEDRARTHLNRLLPLRTDGRRWSPAAAATQALAARAWLRGGSSPTDSSAAQWVALLSDETEPTTSPSQRTQSWQECLSAGDRRHLEVRSALRQMISLPQGAATTFGLADASVAAVALADLRRNLKFGPDVEPSTPELPFDWRDIRHMAERMAVQMPRIAKGEVDILRDRAGRLMSLLRGKAPREHDERLTSIINSVSSKFFQKATTEVKAWEDERRKQARFLEVEPHRRLVDLLWRLSPQNAGSLPSGAEELAWLIAAPAGELSGLLDLFNRGEAAAAALLPHVRHLVETAEKTVNIDDIHSAGRMLADAAEAARLRLGALQ
jgi:hypothetical protein